MKKHWPTLAICLGLLTFSLAGCEMATYSKQSRDRGSEYLQTNQYTEAEGAFRDAVRQNPRDFRSHYYLGQLAERQGQYTSAVTSYKTSLAVQKYNIDSEDTVFRHQTIVDLGKCLAKADTRDTEINSLSNDAPSDKTGETYLILANAFMARGDADSAIAAYNSAQAINPASFEIAMEAGLYFERLGQKPLAEASLRKAYRLAEKDDDQVNNALRRLGVVPGPALKEENELAKPLLPRGPIPEVFPDRNRPALPVPQSPGQPKE